MKAIHNLCWGCISYIKVVSDYKDTNFWKQFTTQFDKLLFDLELFQTTKIQTFESNSQRLRFVDWLIASCFRLQRYKLLKAIHNVLRSITPTYAVVSDYKDTNFWKQFTTEAIQRAKIEELFQTTKIQTFESNSQLHRRISIAFNGCFRLQRYKLLKAIHNTSLPGLLQEHVVSDYKDTNFWKQFTTSVAEDEAKLRLFQTTKIQTFESNSQPIVWTKGGFFRCFRLQRYKLLKAIHN